MELDLDYGMERGAKRNGASRHTSHEMDMTAELDLDEPGNRGRRTSAVSNAARDNLDIL